MSALTILISMLTQMSKERHPADSQSSATATLAAPCPPMPPYIALSPWQQQQQLVVRPFHAYQPWAIPQYPATSGEKSPSAAANDLTGADSKWEGYERTERIIRDIQVRILHFSLSL